MTNADSGHFFAGTRQAGFLILKMIGIGLVVSLLLHNVPTVWAQDQEFCGAIKNVVDRSGSDFDGIRGQKTRAAGGIDFYEAPSIQLPHANECYVAFFSDAGGWQFACVWHSPDAARRQQEYQALAVALKQCYPSARSSQTDSSTSVTLAETRIRVTRQDTLRVPQVSLRVYAQ